MSHLSLIDIRVTIYGSNPGHETIKKVVKESPEIWTDRSFVDILQELWVRLLFKLGWETNKLLNKAYLLLTRQERSIGYR